MNKTKFFPAGINAKKELIWIAAAYLLATGVSCLFFSHLSDQMEIYRTSFGYAASHTYDFPSCARLLNGVMLGYIVVIAGMIVLMGIHYLTHFQGGRSIYLMRRLPRRGELAFRCTIVPLLVIALCVLSAAALTTLYYQYYIGHVPEEIRSADQWRLLWSPRQIKWIWGGFHRGNVAF
jgi:hypothetical protein